MADLNSYTVLHPFDLEHADEEHFAPCPHCDNKTGMVSAGPGLFKFCPVCGGTRQGGPSLGLEPSGHPVAHYLPGQTVHVTAEIAEPLIADGTLAPAAAANVDELLVRAAAARLGLTIA